ncbi:MAG: transposase [Desulfobacterales bacterium]|nr:transposase [Desulfobacterales bacterium]
MAHHVTQRGNRRQQTFFKDEDYQFYLELMSEWCLKFQVETWAYCLMPNHIHLIVVPATKEGLNLAIGEAHRRYTRRINFRQDGVGIYGREDFHPLSWKNGIYWHVRDMWN